MKKKAHILYVEDDETLSFVTKDNLELNGYQITHVPDGNQALQIIPEHHFDLYILDVMLPGIDGYEIAKQIRQTDHQTPILFLTAKSLKEDRLQGLRIGADDYIVKPFSIEELTLKIEVFLKRRKIHGNANFLEGAVGKYTFNYPNQTLCIAGQEPKKLTKREAELLKFLLDRKNQVIERGLILKQIWGKDDYFLGRSLDVFVSRLRKYLNSDQQVKIENIHGVGFRLEVPAHETITE